MQRLLLYFSIYNHIYIDIDRKVVKFIYLLKQSFAMCSICELFVL